MSPLNIQKALMVYINIECIKAIVKDKTFAINQNKNMFCKCKHV